jgi:phosphoglycerate dehydrogenase-like enzyme
MKIVAGWRADARELELVQAQLPQQCQLTTLEAREAGRAAWEVAAAEIDLACRDADGVLGWVLPREAVERAGQLRFVAWMHHGCDRLPLDLFKDRGILLANMVGADSGAFTHAIAEQAWALLLGCAKRVVEKDRGTREARWDPLWEPGFTISELYGKTLAVVGFGTIGRQVAKYGRAFGMSVIAVRKHPQPEPALADQVLGPAELQFALSGADYVVLALPLTPETFRIIDVEALASMPRHAYLINVARGDLVDEAALFSALITDEIAGFATDVWWDDRLADQVGYFPVPSRFGVNRLPNVLGSGDQAGNSLESRDRVIELAAQNMAALIAGREPSHLVDLDTGY